MYYQFSIFEEDPHETSQDSPRHRPRNIQKDRKQHSFSQHSRYKHKRRYKALKLDHINIYGLYDSVGETVAAVFVAPSDAAAERQYFSLLSSPEANMYTLNPADFTLIKFDNEYTVVRSSSDYAPGLIDKARHERLEQFLSRKNGGDS